MDKDLIEWVQDRMRTLSVKDQQKVVDFAQELIDSRTLTSSENFEENPDNPGEDLDDTPAS